MGNEEPRVTLGNVVLRLVTWVTSSVNIGHACQIVKARLKLKIPNGRYFCISSNPLRYDLITKNYKGQWIGGLFNSV
ncbi:hypothetical protein WN48_02889 [Eufriesea mexicana]|uniref:Uncharacterized protein n=1 Tax=Eufriesea mexicana TaxID=516756 RepID=A0A310SN31_9HYME|nr:hypothetical protein WN48_02889 [Eufriesea mexicana]